MLELDVVRLAKEIYTKAPSHALPGYMPEPGCYCVATAVGEAVERLVPTSDQSWFVDRMMASRVRSTMRSVTGCVSLAQANARMTTQEVIEHIFDRTIRYYEEIAAAS